MPTHSTSTPTSSEFEEFARDKSHGPSFNEVYGIQPWCLHKSSLYSQASAERDWLLAKVDPTDWPRVAENCPPLVSGLHSPLPYLLKFYKEATEALTSFSRSSILSMSCCQWRATFSTHSQDGICIIVTSLEQCLSFLLNLQGALVCLLQGSGMKEDWAQGEERGVRGNNPGVVWGGVE